MNVIIIVNQRHPCIGGLSSHIGLLEKALQSRGHHLTLITQNHFVPARIFRGSVKIIYKILRINYVRWVQNKIIKRIQELMVNAPEPLIHCHDYLTAVACGRIATEYGFGLVCTVHGPASKEYVENGWGPNSAEVLFIQDLEKEAWSKCHRIIAVDNGQRDILLQQGARGDIIRVINNAVDLDEIDSYHTENHPLPYRYLLVPRRLSPKCGVEYAIRSLAFLSDVDIRLVIAGDGPLRRQLEELTRSLGFTSRVVFLGSIPRREVICLAWHANAILIPSINIAGFAEATSIAALEGMATARPVIASAVGGLIDMISDGENGLLALEKDPQELAQAVNKVLRDCALAQTLGKQARQTIVDRFSTSTWATKIEEVYQEVDPKSSRQRNV
ncbi:MAG: glycosyltransferase family 4 protein [Candidatus Helarchaeota archaeon]|nr:glycosyltransferase family 4 protein [Candidatus Helarchaeota archaeon]